MDTHDALLDHFNHSNPTVEDDEIVRPAPVAGCEHCETAPLLAEIHAAWVSGNQVAQDTLWDLQDGYGIAGFTPPQGLDWSGIRDSSPTAIRRMHAALHA